MEGQTLVQLGLLRVSILVRHVLGNAGEHTVEDVRLLEYCNRFPSCFRSIASPSSLTCYLHQLVPRLIGIINVSLWTYSL